MKRSAFKKRIIPAIVLIALIAIGAVLYMRSRVSAVFDETKAMRFGPYSRSHTIENKTLLIGTYLIHLQGLTDELYTQAVESGSEAGQDQIYYKSELSGGNWFNISDAGSLGDISKKGTPVEAGEMENLYIRYVVGADGTLIDVLDNKERNPFDLVSPYDLTQLPELEPLRLQYTYDPTKSGITEMKFLENRNAQDAGTLRSQVYYYQLITTFFTLDLRDDQTNKCDEQLNRLYSCYKALKAAQNDKEAELVYSLMSKVDATRRAIVLEKLNQLDESALNELYNLSTGTYYTAYGNFADAQSKKETDAEAYIVKLRDAVKHDFFEISTSAWYESFLARIGLSSGNWWSLITPLNIPTTDKDEDDEDEEEEERVDKDAFAVDQAILDSLSQCMENCQTSYNKQNAKRLQDVDTVLGHAEYTYSMQVIDSASASGLNGDTLNLRYLMDIKNGVINEADGELALLNGTLLPDAESRYSSDAKANASEKYAAAVANDSGEAAMESALDEQKAILESRRSELQYLITEKKRRTPAEAMIEELMRRVTIADSWRDATSKDAFGTKARQSVDEHIAWLKETANALKAEDDSLGSDLDDLKDQMEGLENKMKAALDDNDLQGAEDLKARIDALEQDIADEEKRLATLAANADNAGDAASALMDLGDSMDALADRLLDKAKSRISQEDYDGLKNSINALAGIGATDALEEIKDLLEENGAPATLLAELDEAIEEAEENESLLSDTSDEGAGDEGDGAGDGGTGDGAGAGGAGDGSGDGGEGDGSGDGKGDGKGSGKGGAATAGKSKLENGIENNFDSGDASDMDDDELAATITVLSRLTEEGNKNAEPMAQDYAYQARNLNNGYIYTQFADDKTQEYVSIEAIAAVSSWRYVYDSSRQHVTLTDGNKTWEFQVGSDKALQGGSSELQMHSPAVFQGTSGKGSLYLSETDAREFLECEAQYVKNSDTAICVTTHVDELAKELYDKFGK